MVSTLRVGIVAAGLGGCLAASGCVDRVIREFDGAADGSGGGSTDGVGETEAVVSGTECDEPSDCGPDQTCFESVCVGVGTVRVSLSWTTVTDLDLHLLVPDGDEMSYENPVTSYGQLDVDDCVGGVCENASGTHVENIFLDASAPRGTYQIQVYNFDGRASANYAVEVAGAVSGSFSGSLPAQESFAGPRHVVVW